MKVSPPQYKALLVPSFGKRRRRKRTNGQLTSSPQGLGHEAKRTATQAVVNGMVNIGMKLLANQLGLPV